MPLREVRTFREVDRRDGDQRGRRRRAPRPRGRGVHQGGRRSVRRLRPLGAGRDLRRRHPLRRHRPGPAHPAGLRRARPARRSRASSSTGSRRRRTSTSRSATSTSRSRRRCRSCGCRPARSPPSPAAAPCTSCCRSGAGGSTRCSTSTSGPSCGTLRPAPPVRCSGRSVMPPWPSATGPSARSRSARPSPRGGRPPAGPRARRRHRQAGGRRRPGGHGGRPAPAGPAVPGRGGVRAGRRRRLRRRALPRAAVGMGHRRVRRATATRRARSSPAG